MFVLIGYKGGYAKYERTFNGILAVVKERQKLTKMGWSCEIKGV